MATLRTTSSNHVPRLFTSGEVQEIVGLTQRKLGYWDKTALAHPHGRQARGSGSRRLYTLLDVVKLKLIVRLRQSGLSLQKIRRALLNLSDFADEPAPIGELEVITDGNRVLIRRSNEQLMDPISWQYAFCLPVADLLDEIEQQVSSVQAWGGGNGGGVDAKVVLQ
ncbi:MAG: MerR family transcriptional regulator [Chloroflexota bacterium]|nr:MerR family transcriptional regulator [Chloroflexota bacterium]